MSEALPHHGVSLGDCEYFSHLASQTGTDIRGVDIISILKDVEPGNRRAINQAFFAFEKQVKSAPQLPELAISDALLASMDETKKNRIEWLFSQRQSSVSSAKEHYSRYLDHVEKCWEFTKEHHAIEQRSPSYMVDSLKELLQGGFWKFEKFEENCISLSTTGEVIMRETNPAIGLNRVVNLGQSV